MNESTDNTEFEHGLALLHQQASYTNGAFDRHLPTRWRRVLRSRLRKVQEVLTATDVLLFRVSCRQDTDQTVRLLGRANGKKVSEHPADCQRFAFRLLPADIQTSLKSDSAVKLSGSSGAGGRLLQQLQSDLEGDETYVVPLFRRDRKLVGLMVVISSCGCEETMSPSQKSRLTEQLRQNGLILLTNVQRQRKMVRQEREMLQWRKIADNACDFAMQVNGRLLITQVVPFGYGEKHPAVEGLRLTDIVDRTFHRRMKHQIALALKDGKVRTIEFRLTLGAEPPSWYHVRIEPLVNSTDGHCMLYLTNNTQDKGLQSEINRLNEQLVRASRLGLLGQMSTEFAHQLNQPLQAILAFCNLTLKRMERGTDTPEKTQTALKQIETSVTHAGNIIDSIREFARHRSLKIRPVSLSQILEDAIMMVTDRAHQLDGEFAVSGLQKDHDVMADRTQSTHVFINLFVNALEAASEFGVDPPLVNVRIEDPDDTGRIIVAVKDNGPGLPPVNPDQVFEKFHTQKEDGLGLGLTISREVCEAQHGSLHAANNAHESGCTFFVAFQAAETDPDGPPLERETAVD